MPPPKKGAKAIEEDFSDVPTLPALNTLLFSLVLEFKNKERKQTVLNKIKEHWNVKVITREDIIDYGRKKLTIQEDEDLKDVDKVAKAASEKLFEQFVTARREKRDRIAKLTEEAKAQATEENPDPKPQLDPNAIDCYFHLPDFPANYKEAAALNRHKYALNTLIHIEERPVIIEKKGQPEIDGDGNPIEGSEEVIMEEEQIPEANRVPEDEINKQKQLIADLKHALKDSAKDSAIRSFVVISKEYNHRIVDAKPAPEGIPESELTEEHKGFNSVNEVANDVKQTLEKTASNLLKYLNFKQNANLIPLKAIRPTPENESRLDDHAEPEHEIIEPEPAKEETKVGDKSKIADKSKAGDKSKPDDKSKALDKSAVEPEKAVEESHHEQSMSRDWNYESYKSVVNNLPEDKRSIAGLLSACVLNICDELEKQNKVLDDQEEIDEVDEYKYIFDDVFGDIAASNGFAARENIVSPTASIFSKSAQRSMFSSTTSKRGNWNQDVVLDVQDVCSYADDYILENGDSISAIEHGIFSYLRVPGYKRTNMPNYPEKSELKRNAERPEVYPFCTVPIEELERAMLLKSLEDQFTSKESDFQWNFLERCIEEKFHKKAMIQVLSDVLLWDPDTIIKYFSRDDSLLLGVYHKLPADKSYTKQWKASYRSLPDFGNWLEHFSKDSNNKMSLYDIDDNKVGNIKEFIQNLTPANGGVMRIKKLSIGCDEISQVECFKDGMIFGIQQKETANDQDYFWIHYDRNTRFDFRNIEGISRYITSLPKDDLSESKHRTGNDAPHPEDDEATKLRKQQEAEERATQEKERHQMLHEVHSSFKLKGAAGTLALNNGALVTLLPNGYVMQSKSKMQRYLSQNTHAEAEDNQEESRIITEKSLIRYLVNGKIEIMYANGNFSQYDPSTDLWTVTNNQGNRRCKRQSDGFEYDIEPIPAAIETCAETDAQVLFKEDNVICVMYPNGTRYTVHHDGTKILTNEDETEIIYEKVGYSLVKVLSGRMLDEPENIKRIDQSDASMEFYQGLQVTRQYLKDRARDQRVIQTYLHDKTVIQSFVEESLMGGHEFGEAAHNMHDMEGTGEHHMEGSGIPEGDMEDPQHHDEGTYSQAVHLIRRQDLSITKITSDGEACVISGGTRGELNKYGNLMKIGKDVDYLYQLFDMRTQERKGGIFTCSLNKSNIVTHDKDRNYFAVNANGTFEKVLAPELSEVDNIEDGHEMHDGEGAREYDDAQFNEEELRSRGKTVVPKVEINASKAQLFNTIPVPPRIFWVKVDGSGSEFLTKEKMQEETGRYDHDVMIVKSTEFIGQNPVFMHTYFKQLKSYEEIDEEYSAVAELQARKIKECKKTGQIAIPKNVEEYSQMFRKLVDVPKSKIYLYRNFMQHKDFDQFKTLAYYEDLARFKKWKDDSDAACNKRFGLFEVNENMKDREIDRRIMTKIYRERQKPNEEFDYKTIKDRRLQAITTKYRKVAGREDSGAVKVEEQDPRMESQKDIVDDHNADYEEEGEGHHESIYQEKAPEPAGMGMDMNGPRKKRTQIVMEEISELKREPYFLPNYFETQSGQEFLIENPPRMPNEEILMRMSQRMSRSIGATEDGHRSSNEADRVSQYTQNKDMDDNRTGELGSPREEMNDNAIVALEPEDDEDRDQMRMSGMKQSQARSNLDGTLEEPNYVPSMYLQERDYLHRKDEEQLLKAEEYHVSKTKEFNVYGKLRPLKLKVKSLAKSKIKPEMNEKFITTECITDKRIKISSMANRAYLNAPSVNQVRKQGQHQMILQAISKKQTFNELISQANAMVTSVLNDPLKRSVNILPSQANFGSLREGTKYE